MGREMIHKLLQKRGRRRDAQAHQSMLLQVAEIASSFDPVFYKSTCPTVEGDVEALAEHYLTVGWKSGLDPSAEFSTSFYLTANPDVADSGLCPLLHYLRYGILEGRATKSSSFSTFAGGNVTKTQPQHLGSIQSAPRHPDANSVDHLFDTQFYRLGFPPGEAPRDPTSHYLATGWKEGRDPTPWFSTRHYLALNSDVAKVGMNPFLHYCLSGHTESRQLVRLGRNEAQDVFRAHAASVSEGPHFEELDGSLGANRSRRAKVLAYYLPQFHPTNVNDENWGRGFTEWRNLPRALPRFEGHIQPRIPRDLGCYDLSEGDVMRRQIDLARAAGLYGFCFYYYWFDGSRVLQDPIDRLLSDPTLDFPFCLMWANENWTRTWDGAEDKVILKQSYDPEQDHSLIDDLARHMTDPRYIRIDGRPLFFIYRPGHVTDASETIARWRRLFEQRHGLKPLIMMAQGFGDLDPRTFGLDGAIEFPPHKLLQDMKPINNRLKFFDSDYKGHIFDYDTVIEASLNETAPDFPLIKTATPNWDNEARRPGRGMAISGSTPSKFEFWLNQLIEYSNENPVFGESFVCVNAWNEWAEGAVLEPDVYYGGSYLNALSRAVHGLHRSIDRDSPRILIVGHDANQNGAQKLALNMGRTLVSQFGFEVTYFLGADGPLLDEYRRIGNVIISRSEFSDTESVVQALREQGYHLAITNTTPSGRTVPHLKSAGFKVLSLVHELPVMLQTYGLEEPGRRISGYSDHVIFPAEVVRQKFEECCGNVANVSEVYPQGLYNSDILEFSGGGAELRSELGLGPKTKIVLGVGYGDLRKGIDRFISSGLSICAKHPEIVFLWVGDAASDAKDWLQLEIISAGLADRVQILGHRDDVVRFYAAANALYLSSREDPFPSVVLEALAAGLPVVGHEGCGGCDDLIRRHGVLVERRNPLGAASAILKAIKRNPAAAAEARREEVRTNFGFDKYVFGLLQRLDPNLASVSAVVPSYNYERYIEERLQSVFEQTYPLREVIVLDDASSDGSVSTIKLAAEAARRKITLTINERNSGSPFVQWRRAAELAKGDYIWIAEADDLADPSFVARLIDHMQLHGSVLGFTDSRQIDENGQLLGDSYRPYINQIEAGAFDRSFDMDGREFLARYLAVKNVILNVSGVVILREALLDAFDRVADDLSTYSVAGDWRLYAEVCSHEGSRVSWLAEPLNTHRRHRGSVTQALKVDKHLTEIRRMHDWAKKHAVVSREGKHLQRRHLLDAGAHLFQV